MYKIKRYLATSSLLFISYMSAYNILDSSSNINSINSSNEIKTNHKIDVRAIKYDKPDREISGFIWKDKDKDDDDAFINKNIYNEGVDKLIEDSKVSLKDSDGVVLKETITDKDGRYKFTNLKDGEYLVDFSGILEDYAQPVISNFKSEFIPISIPSIDSDGIIDVRVKIKDGKIEGNDNEISAGFYE